MAEIKKTLESSDNGNYTVTPDHSISDILRHLVDVEGFDPDEIKIILDLGL